MRFLRSYLIFVILLTLALSQITMAQEQAKENASQKIAFVDTKMFADEKEGILVYVKAINQIEVEFKPLKEEIEKILAKINAITEELNSIHGCPDMKTVNDKSNEQEYLIRLFKAKIESYKTLFQKRENEVMEPIERDIYKELKEFVLERGYKVVLDVNKGLCIVFSKETEILTKEFIAYYNSKHPVTNSQTQVKLSEPK